MPTVTADTTVADYLLQWRAKLGLTQEEAAARLGITSRTIKRWEAGEACKYPRLVVLACERVMMSSGVV